MYERFFTATIALFVALAAFACDQNSGEPEEQPSAGAESEPQAKGEESGEAEAEAEPEPYVPEGPTGTIEGRVVLEGEPPERVPLRRGSDPFCDQGEMLSETVITGEDAGLENVFARAQGDFEAPTPQAPVVIDQSECMYRPRVQGAVAGQTLRVKNSDETLHNVHAREMTLDRESARSLYNDAQPANSGDIERPIETSDLLELRCDLHSWMRAFVIVSDHPHFSTTGEEGRFRIENVPTGSHELETWHELYGSKSVDVTVEEGETASLNLTYDAEADRRE